MSMVGYADQFVQLYLDIMGIGLKSLCKVATPHVNDSTLCNQPGSMKPHASKVRMKGLWLAQLVLPGYEVMP